MPRTLTGKQRRFLRALAHDLKPIVQVGHAGLTAAVLRQLGEALTSHELVKVKLAREAPLTPDAAVPDIEAETQSSVVQVVGRTLVVYRARAEGPTIVLPAGPEAAEG